MWTAQEAWCRREVLERFGRNEIRLHQLLMPGSEQAPRRDVKQGMGAAGQAPTGRSRGRVFTKTNASTMLLAKNEIQESGRYTDE